MNQEKLIAFDESGHTNGQMLDRTQPVFVLASVRLSVDQATELLKLFDLQKGAVELKFANIKKSGKHQKSIVALLNHSYINRETAKISIFHKEYCIWALTVDRIMDPVFYDGGLDVYIDGLNIALTNLFYFCAPVFCSKELTEEYKIKFQALFKKKDAQSISDYYSVVSRMIQVCKDEYFASLLNVIFTSQNQIARILDKHKATDFNNYLTAFVHQADYWGRMLQEEYDVYVDNYKYWEDFKPYFESVKAITSEELIGTDRRTMQLPLKIRNVITDDSEKSSVIQIADIIAGAAQYYTRSLVLNKPDTFSQQIGATNIVNLNDLVVWPEQAFTPDALQTKYTGGRSLVDDLARLQYKKDKGL